MKVGEKITDYYECSICDINSLTKNRMCPCPRGSCGAEVKGRIKTTVVVEYFTKKDGDKKGE